MNRKRLLSLSLVFNLGLLFVFKYFDFFVTSFTEMWSMEGADFLHVNILLPVGISFYTFQTMSYSIDIYRNQQAPAKNFIDFTLFISFFPQLVAGPIERAKTMLPQLSRKLSPTKQQLKEGVSLIVLGLFRKVIIGDSAGRYVDHIYHDPELYMSIEILTAVLLYTVQIYADFSGYSRIARGAAKMLGVDLSINFNQPFFSKNISEFWRRWHITLSTWLRDYLYVPLGGNRLGRNRKSLNLMIVMILGGAWHGAGWNFAIWGAFHGFLLLIYNLFFKDCKWVTTQYRVFDWLKSLSIFVLVSISFLFFRTESLDQALFISQKLIYWEISSHTWLFTKVILAFLSLTFILDLVESYYGHTFLLRIRSTPLRLGITSSLLVFTLIYMLQTTPAPFIYFQF
ncbi:MBOAT family protein [Roseivirga sp. E12]|uniref:MBOAT family O-acyltransferase n=1 Tax=Roseivirga sp. E12 TaxID=2819237 RepID=UPI001ABCECCE|nr:MBOAT family protein [Roseivirga sp. E12]MBO3697282.1 MBOAT family protein [Roseivirga sp. E12]